MRIYDIINKKKNGLSLSKEEIDFFVKGVTDRSIPDYQTTALLMAIVLIGMTDEETFYLTDAMAHSGDIVCLDEIKGTKVDKHSTGGVGDSTTFVVLPILASLGLKCAKMSGRGLGHTGGTLDKLESIGTNVEIGEEEFFREVNGIGLAVIGQTKNICPADKILYSLRDVTATVDSIPLIASSIMSKKLAGGSDVIALDVKTGEGAFMKTVDSAVLLAEKMVAIGKAFNKKISAVITDMNEPLDNYVGNSLEIYGALKVLEGEQNELYEVSKALVKEACRLSEIEVTDEDIDLAIKSGKAKEKFVNMIKWQNGDVGYIEDKEKLKASKYTYPIICNYDGYVKSFDLERLGLSICKIGGGREKADDKIDYFVGAEINVKVGDKVNKGDTLGVVYQNKPNDISSDILDCIRFSSKKCEKLEKVIKIIK